MTNNGKTFILLFILFILLALAVYTTGQPEGFFPFVEGAVTITHIGVIVLLVAGFLWLFEKTHMSWWGYALLVSLALGVFIVAELVDIVNVVPESQDSWVNILLQVLILLLTPLGFFRIRQILT